MIGTQGRGYTADNDADWTASCTMPASPEGVAHGSTDHGRRHVGAGCASVRHLPSPGSGGAQARGGPVTRWIDAGSGSLATTTGQHPANDDGSEAHGGELTDVGTRERQR